MNKTLTISFVFSLSCFSMLTQPTFAAPKLVKPFFLQELCLSKITKEEMAILLKDANSIQLKQFSEDTEAKKKIADNLKELLATACEARKEGFADEPDIKRELTNIRAVLTATLYDKKINAGQAQPFAFITERQITEFWNDKSRQAEFQDFLDAKVALAKQRGDFPKDKALTEDEIKQAKDDYAKIKIYEAEEQAKAGELGEDFRRELELQIKLQQAQFLASQYAQNNLVDKLKISDAEIQNYIALHPELNLAGKKAKAEEVLKRVQAGENFAGIADRISEDPGTKGNGGLYKDVAHGKMIPAFESAALALEAGKIGNKVVETPYGYHIIKLEKKGEMKGADGKQIPTYDVRHILISTTVKDPNNPAAREMPVFEMVRQTLEEEKQKKILEKIVADNPVEIAEDFEVPAVSSEMIVPQPGQKMLQGQLPNKIAIGKTLPKKIEIYLNRYYKGWKITQRDCDEATSNGLVSGDFDGNKKPDFAVKFIRGRKGYILAFLNNGIGYKPFVLHNYTAEEAKYSILSVLKKGELFENDSKKLRLKYDAPSDYRCESDVGGIHYYRNGKFVDY